MRLDDLIHSLDRTDPLSEAYKTNACIATLPPELVEFDTGADDSVFEAALRASGLRPIVEHLYPHPTSQQQ